jgi:glutamate synthase domain-containing protein 2/glutamate synthase domain-containing protein 1/glutamate synthase domain-containing protein 3
MDPRSERDACGIGFVADAHGRASRAILDAALRALSRMRHRGALASDAKTGDGAGVLVPLPRRFLAWVASEHRLDAPVGQIGIAMCFVDHGEDGRGAARDVLRRACAQEGIELVGWREVPTDVAALGERAFTNAPRIEQAVLASPHADRERRAFRARKRAEREARELGIELYVCSMSFRTVVYKALCAADQLAAFFVDLRDPDFAVPFAVFHQRFSTNTAPSWRRAQPFRTLCHNGEINTIQGNVNLMRAREGGLGGDLADPALLAPVIDPDGSDSAMLDNAAELLTQGGRDLSHALAMLVPRAWESRGDLPEAVRDFYRYHACLTEPWDGPAGLVFSDGRVVGAALDRNGLRPLRYAVREDGLVACASEAGAIDLGPAVRRGKLGPGQMLLVDLEAGILLEDAEIAAGLATRRPYGEWLSAARVADPFETGSAVPIDLQARQVAFGFTKEEITVVLRPMATQGQEPTSSMGDDTAAPPLANRPRPVTSYLRQRFAQVTNPPIDHLRERLVMSTVVRLGRRAPLLEERADAADLLELPGFAVPPAAIDALQGFTLDATFPLADGPEGLQAACVRVADQAEAAARQGADILVVSDAAVSGVRAPIPSVLAVGAVHQRLLRRGVRTNVGLVADAGDVRDTHDLACLLGAGAEVVCPRTAIETITELSAEGRLGAGAPPAPEAVARLLGALEDGVLKIMSKMGIATVDAYRGAQIFEALGLDDEVIELCLTGTPVALGGVGFLELGADVLARHAEGYERGAAPTNPGYIKHRADGEFHATNPEVVEGLQAAVIPLDAEMRAAHALQRAVRGGDPDAYERFSTLIHSRPPTEPRDLLEAIPAGPPIPLEEVEPAGAILGRFSSGAMSHGALSAEAHETVALAMRLVGGKANSGEGGEDRTRYRDDRNCGIKQVASGRFGVTPEYLVFAEELQIKMGQGSKPGEGGQLPGGKVTDEIARLRHTPPGVALISPPPHHDIYSIEDLAQLIFDLRQASPVADVSVKLVSSVGVGTIAAGVAKAGADVIHVAGGDGGTGASPLSSIKNAGLPWEVGLAETRETLAENDLRGHVRLRVDGGIKTGRDVLMGALLGADEFSFGTAALVALGCIMVRTCHRDTCPVGIASQRPDLRAKFAGTPEMAAAYLVHVAEELRVLLASLGLHTLDQAVGRVDLLRTRPAPEGHRTLKVETLLSSTRSKPTTPVTVARERSILGDRLHADAFQEIADGRIAELVYPISSSDRSVGACLGGAIAKAVGDDRPPGRVRARFEGAAGQSFGAFLSDGVELDLTGEANDYVGKGMAGGRIVIRPPDGDPGDPVLLGNTVLYGATGGQLFCAGSAGERFAVRNSGAVAVVEGAGDHACEYMTGGAVVILGSVGRNMAAGMSGGEAYVWDPEERLESCVNPQLVEMRAPTPGQLPSLKRLIDRHHRATGSPRAAILLEGWEQHSSSFVRVAARAEVAMIEAALEGTTGTGA